MPALSPENTPPKQQQSQSQQQNGDSTRDQHDSEQSITIELIEQEEAKREEVTRPSRSPRRKEAVKATKSMTPTRRPRGTSPVRRLPLKTDKVSADKRARLRRMKSETSLGAKKKLSENMDGFFEEQEEDLDGSFEELMLRSSGTAFVMTSAASNKSKSRLVIPAFRKRVTSITSSGEDTASSDVPRKLPPKRSNSFRTLVKRSKSNISEYYEARKSLTAGQGQEEDEKDQKQDKQAIPTHALHAPRKPIRTTDTERDRGQIGTSDEEVKHKDKGKAATAPSRNESSSRRTKKNTPNRSLQDRMYPQPNKDRGASFYKEGLKNLSQLDRSSASNMNNSANLNSDNNASKTKSSDGSFSLHMSLEDFSKDKTDGQALQQAQEEEDSLHLSQEDLTPKHASPSHQKKSDAKIKKASFYREGLRSLQQLTSRDLPTKKAPSSPRGKARKADAVSDTNVGRFLQKGKPSLSTAEKIRAKAEKNFNRQKTQQERQRKLPTRTQSLSEKLIRSTPSRTRNVSTNQRSGIFINKNANLQLMRVPHRRTRSGLGHVNITGNAMTNTKQQLPRRRNTSPPDFLARMSSSFSQFESLKRRQTPKRSFSTTSAAALGQIMKRMERNSTFLSGFKQQDFPLKSSIFTGSARIRKSAPCTADATSSFMKDEQRAMKTINKSTRRAPLKRANTWVFSKRHDALSYDEPHTDKASGRRIQNTSSTRKGSASKLTVSKVKRPSLRRSNSDSGQYFRDKASMLLLPSEKRALHIDKNNSKIISKKKSQQMKAAIETKDATPSATINVSTTQQGRKHRSLIRNLPRSTSVKLLMPGSKETKRGALRRSNSGFPKEALHGYMDLSPLPALRFPRRKQSFADERHNIKQEEEETPAAAESNAIVAGATRELETLAGPCSAGDARKVDIQSSTDTKESRADVSAEVLRQVGVIHGPFILETQASQESGISDEKEESKSNKSAKHVPLRYIPPEPVALLPDLDLPVGLDDDDSDELAVSEWEFSVPKPPELLPEPALCDHRPMAEREAGESSMTEKEAAKLPTYVMSEPPELLPEPDFPKDDPANLDVDCTEIHTTWNFSLPEPPNLLSESILSENEYAENEESTGEISTSPMATKRGSRIYSMPKAPALLHEPSFLDEDDLISDEKMNMQSLMSTAWDFSAPAPPALLPEPSLPDERKAEGTLVERPFSGSFSDPEQPELLVEPSLPPEDDERTPGVAFMEDRESLPMSLSNMPISWNFSAPQLLPDPTFSDDENSVDDDSGMYIIDDINHWSFSAPETPKLLPEPALPSEEDSDEDQEDQHIYRRFSACDVAAATRYSGSASDESSERDEDDHYDCIERDFLMDLRRDKFNQGDASVNNLTVRQYRANLMTGDEVTKEPCDESGQQDMFFRQSLHMDDLKRGSLRMDDLVQHSSFENTESSMDIDGAHYSMSVLEKEDPLSDLPSFAKDSPRTTKRLFHASCSALDFVQFAPCNFVQQSHDSFDDHYELGQLLGEGEFGEVYIGYRKQGGDLGEERAIKIIDKHKMTSGDYEQVINEFNLLKGLTHPNLLTLYAFYEDDKSCYIVSDICKGGELWDEIDARGNFDEEAAATFMTHLLSAVSFLQSHNIAHRDINLENILLEENKDLDRMKIIDFGLATKYEDGVKLTDLVGKVHYVAPEVLYGEYEGSKYDVWSCGVVCFILLSGCAPFEGDTDAQVRESVIDGVFKFSEPVWDGISDEAKDFVNLLLTYEQELRPNAEQALKHAWIKNSIKANAKKFMANYVQSSITCFENMQDFTLDASLKLRQAIYTYIASQLLGKKEREEIDRVFRGMDYDCDGKLSKSDIREGYKNFFNKELSSRETDRMFHRINTSETGFIDYTEFVIAAMERSKILDAGKLRAAFSSFDRGNKGFISADDLKVALAGVVAVPVTGNDNVQAEDIINEMIKQVDVEGDGNISYDNFVSIMIHSGDADKPSNLEATTFAFSMPAEEKKGEPAAHFSSTSEGAQNKRKLDYDWATASFIGHDSEEFATVRPKKGLTFKSEVVAVAEDEGSTESTNLPDESLRIQNL